MQTNQRNRCSVAGRKCWQGHSLAWRAQPWRAQPWRGLLLAGALISAALSLQRSALGQQAICAQVKIEILQELTLEREAFEARMTINNGVPGVALDNLSVDVNFADKNGTPVRATSESE